MTIKFTTIMREQQPQKEATRVSGDTLLYILVSSDMLAIPLTDPICKKDDMDILLDGKDEALYVLCGNEKSVFELIDNCYKARENNDALKINTQDGLTIYFK